MCGKADILLTEGQVARRLGISRAEMRELAEEPGFPPSSGVITASSPPYSTVPFWLWDDVADWRHARERAAGVAPLVTA